MIKEHCYLYDSNKKECRGLKKLYCKNENCRFFITPSEFYFKELKNSKRMEKMNNG